jgi:4-hydroxy-tetrahydrodipicolinate reductase
MITPKKIGLIGASGRMGLAIAQLVEAEFHDRAKISARYSRSVGDLVELSGVDIVIDFSLPLVTEALCDWLEARQGTLPALVSGTTGLTQAQLNKLSALSKRTNVMHSPNFSAGVATVKYLLQVAAPILNNMGYTPVLTDTHHDQKKDAPSGTAIALRETIEKSSSDPVHVNSVRAGNVVGKHEIVFYGGSDQIVISHEALNRDLFARGALDAALWLSAQPLTRSLFSMDDYLKQRYQTP